MERGEAETMFRVDFFEWYVLLERCLVCLLASVGVNVSAGYDPRNGSGVEYVGGRVGAARKMEGGGTEALIGDAKAFAGLGGYGHRFHENVLAALDSVDRNPLHEILAKGRVREYFGVAKEFRNRWKDVDEGSGGYGEDLEVVMDRKLKRYEELLQDLNLDEMLGCILEAMSIARGRSEEELGKIGVQLLPNGQERFMSDLDTDEPFEAGVDAMEWD